MPFPNEFVLAPVTLIFLFCCFLVMCELFMGFHNAGDYVVTWGQVFAGISPWLKYGTLGLGLVVLALFRMDCVNEERARTGQSGGFCWGYGGKWCGWHTDDTDGGDGSSRARPSYGATAAVCLVTPQPM